MPRPAALPTLEAMAWGNIPLSPPGTSTCREMTSSPSPMGDEVILSCSVANPRGAKDWPRATLSQPAGPREPTHKEAPIPQRMSVHHRDSRRGRNADTFVGPPTGEPRPPSGTALRAGLDAARWVRSAALGSNVRPTRSSPGVSLHHSIDRCPRRWRFLSWCAMSLPGPREPPGTSPVPAASDHVTCPSAAGSPHQRLARRVPLPAGWPLQALQITSPSAAD